MFPPLEVLLLPGNAGVDGNGAEMEAGGGEEEGKALPAGSAEVLRPPAKGKS